MPERTGEHLLRQLAPQVLGAVVRRYAPRDFGAAEDAVQEALVAAAFQWPRTGAPEDPRAWLIKVAARKLTELEQRIREMEAMRAKLECLLADWDVRLAGAIPGERAALLETLISRPASRDSGARRLHRNKKERA